VCHIIARGNGRDKRFRDDACVAKRGTDGNRCSSGLAGLVKYKDIKGVPYLPSVLTSVSAKDIEGAGFTEEFSSNLSALVAKRALMAKAAGCAGVVCSGQEVKQIKAACGREFIAVTPGIRPAWQAGDDDQRRIVTPARAIADGSDYLVIGRPIRDAKDPVWAARKVAEEIGEVIN